MKHYCLLLLLLAIIIFVGSKESSSAAPDPSSFVKYHGTRRYWTSIDSTGKTYISLNTFKEAVDGSVKLVFPNDKNLRQILSDITLYSVANAECRADTNKLEFKLVIDEQNLIRGKVKAEVIGRKIMAYIYEVCDGVENPDPYAHLMIHGQYSIIDSPNRACSSADDHLQDSGNSKNAIQLEVSGSLKCQTFMVLPAYMDVEDVGLQPDSREPVNVTFAAQGEDFWWKDSNNELLSDGISFTGRDVVINITNSTKAIPYFLRIGKNQPYPSLNFYFDPACSNQQYDLYVNLRGNDNCRIRLALIENRIKITTNDVSIEILDATKSPTLVFARGQSKVYMKAGSHLAVAAMGVCQIENPTDVPDDQFVIQIAPTRGYTVCNTAQVLLPAGDIKGKIEILLDRVKAAALIPVFNETDYSTSSTAPVKPTYSPPGKTTEVSEAGFEWWWILVGILLFVFVVVVIIGILLCICNRRKESKSKLNNGQKEEKLHPIPKGETVIIPVEEAPPKDKKRKKEKMNGKKEAAEQEIGGSNKSAKQSGKERKNHFETLPKNPPNQWQQQSEGESSHEQTGEMAAIQKSVTTQKSSDYVSYRK